MSVMAPNVTTLKNVRGRIAHRWTQHHIRVIAQKVLIVTVLGMIASLPVASALLPVASGAARHDRYPVEYELPHLPHELLHLPHELPHVSRTDDAESKTNLGDAEALDPLVSCVGAAEKEEEQGKFVAAYDFSPN
jgi:hypothetical protein